MLKTLFIIKFLMLITAALVAQDINGNWNGMLKAGEVEIGFVFTIQQTENGLTGSMAIPARNLRNMKASKVTFENNELLIDGSNNGWQYIGIYNSSKELFQGHFQEGVNKLPLLLKKGDLKKVAAVKRPQEPKSPLPYKAEEVNFRNETAGINMAGTLTLPKNISNPPVAVLISGSGPQNRDQEIFGHKPFLVLADHLTRSGIAVLRYDDRGVNDSEGEHALATSADFATDVMAAVEYLKARTDINTDQIGLVGHSEGGIIAPLVANRMKNDIAFLVNLAGTGVSGYETTLMQALHAAKHRVPDLEDYEQFLRGALDIAAADEEIEVVREKLSKYYLNSVYFNQSVPVGADKEAILKALIDARTSMWIRYFYHYNPAEEYKQVKCPVLSLNGSKDTQVFAEPNQEGLKAALSQAQTRDFQVIELEGLNHLFQKAETGETDEYRRIEETFNPEALKLISDWIRARTLNQ